MGDVTGRGALSAIGREIIAEQSPQAGLRGQWRRKCTIWLAVYAVSRANCMQPAWCPPSQQHGDMPASLLSTCDPVWLRVRELCGAAWPAASAAIGTSRRASVTAFSMPWHRGHASMMDDNQALLPISSLIYAHSEPGIGVLRKCTIRLGSHRMTAPVFLSAADLSPASQRLTLCWCPPATAGRSGNLALILIVFTLVFVHIGLVKVVAQTGHFHLHSVSTPGSPASRARQLFKDHRSLVHFRSLQGSP